MADPIRPFSSQVAPPTPAAPRANAQALAAQRAFFQAALAKTAPAAAPNAPRPVQAPAPATAAAPSQAAARLAPAQTATVAEPAPTRFARPGSRVNIVV
jgi:hypothetical protein